MTTPMQDKCLVGSHANTEEDLAKGGVMTVCPRSLQPAQIIVQHPPQLEVLSILATSASSGCRMCVAAVYKCPHQTRTAYVSLLGNYITNLPQIVPTIVLGDVNISPASSSPLIQLMSSRGFTQLVQVPTTDSGSLIDYIYYNGTTDNTFVDVVDTYYSDHDATYLSFQL